MSKHIHLSAHLLSRNIFIFEIIDQVDCTNEVSVDLLFLLPTIPFCLFLSFIAGNVYYLLTAITQQALILPKARLTKKLYMEHKINLFFIWYLTSFHIIPSISVFSGRSWGKWN